VLTVGLMFSPAAMKNAARVPAVATSLGARSLSILSNPGFDTVVRMGPTPR